MCQPGCPGPSASHFINCYVLLVSQILLYPAMEAFLLSIYVHATWTAFALHDGVECADAPCCPADFVNYVEFPAEGHALGQLHAWAQASSSVPERFAWLSEAGIFHGRVDLQRSVIPPTELEYLPRRGLLPLPALAHGHGSEQPVALVTQALILP